MKRVGHKSVMQRVGEKWFLVLNYRLKSARETKIDRSRIIKTKRVPIWSKHILYFSHKLKRRKRIILVSTIG